MMSKSGGDGATGVLCTAVNERVTSCSVGLLVTSRGLDSGRTCRVQWHRRWPWSPSRCQAGCSLYLTNYLNELHQ
ncbi:hypothetical protein E2C01_019582 [Portunus trituberculatus]|uniref:Uncharacterized protein n=1 Tax=Portunus trituberculatus TaxID=210409 RepID=A0A5B7DZS3_PORTR|nr:hypothetical protein [Portunus trituberculatus]